MRRRLAVAATVMVLAVAIASCGDDEPTTESLVPSTSGVTSTIAVSTTVAAQSTTSKPATSTTVAPTTAVTSTTKATPTTAATTTTATTTTATATPDCSPEAFAGLASAVMGDAFGGVDVDRCEGGFARFFGMPIDPERFEAEQFFVRWESGVWVVIDSGTGLTCDDPGNPPDLAEACAALGLSS